MGFFSNLKKRLFTLNIDDKPKKTRKKIENTTQVDIDNLVAKKKQSSPEFDNAKKIKSLDFGFLNNDKSSKSIFDETDKKYHRQRAKQKKINKYIVGMKKTGTSFSSQLKELQTRHIKIDESYFNDLEEILIMADISLDLVIDIIDEIKKEVRFENVADLKAINEIIADKLFSIYASQSHISTHLNIKEERVNVILVVGVNGSGKTTTIAKLANNLKQQNKKILIAAADTFRAGAVEQLCVWAKRINCDIVKSQIKNADPSSIVFDAVKKAKNEKYDVLIVDTAGRLQNKVNLMNELNKMNKILKTNINDAPHESLLILDSTTGQNGVSQAIKFKEITDLTGIVLTKMDGTSKGGIVFTIRKATGLPVKFLGLGEQLDDLLEFDLDNFIYGLTKDLMNDQK